MQPSFNSELPIACRTSSGVGIGPGILHVRRLVNSKYVKRKGLGYWVLGPEFKFSPVHRPSAHFTLPRLTEVCGQPGGILLAPYGEATLIECLLQCARKRRRSAGVSRRLRCRARPRTAISRSNELSPAALRTRRGATWGSTRPLNRFR